MKPIHRAWLAGSLATSLVGGALAVAVEAAHADTEPVTAPIAAPQNLSPDDSSAPAPLPVRKTVKLNWSPVVGANGYRVEVGTDETWSNDPILTRDVYYSELTLPLWVPNATYVWRVAALRGGAVGHWSSETGQAHSDPTFVKGWRAAPTPAAVTSPFVGAPTFRWSPVPEASGYEFQASTKDFGANSSTASPDTSPSPVTDTQAPAQPTDLIADCFTARTRYTPSQSVVGEPDSVGPCKFDVPQDGTPVFWRVRALDAYVEDGQTVATTPETKNGASMFGIKTLASTPDLKSGCPHGPSGASPSPSATATASASPTTSAAPAPEELTCEPSRPSVFGTWARGTSFSYSGAAPVTTVGPLVTTTSLASDPDGLCTVTNSGSAQAEHALCRDVPTLRWTAVSGKPLYRVVIALDDAMTNIQYEEETPALQWTFPGSLRDSPSGASFYYAVQACDLSSCNSVTSTPPSFSKQTPRPTLGAVPGVAGDLKLSWQSYAAALGASIGGGPATQDAYAYHVQVARADHPSFDQVIDDKVVDETYLSPDASYGDGQFVWRVQPVDSKGDRLPYSLSQAFTRDATPPRAISVAPSSGVSTKAPLKVTFSEPVSGVSGSSLTLTPAAAAIVTVTSSTTATITPTAALLPGGLYRIVLSSAIKDLSGNIADPTGPSVTVDRTVPDSSPALRYAGTWKVLGASSASGGSYHSSTPATSSPTSAGVMFYGTGAAIYSCLGPANGYLDVYLDGTRRLHVSTYRSYSGCGIKVATLSNFNRGTHTLRLVGPGTHVSGSKGTSIAVDTVVVFA